MPKEESELRDELPLTTLQREELDRRLDELEREGPTGLTWDEVMAEVRKAGSA